MQFKVQGSGLVQGVVLVPSETRKFEDAPIRAVLQGVPKKGPEAGLCKIAGQEGIGFTRITQHGPRHCNKVASLSVWVLGLGLCGSV